ncbi:MAG: hypothetical protein WD556_11330 [Actinomycetota bacterium]
MTGGDDAPKTKVPEWALERMERALNDLQQVMDVLHLSMSGISSLRGMPGMVEILAELHEDTSEETERRLADAKRSAQLAQSEVENGFPLIHRQAVLSLCSVIDALVWDICAAWLREVPEALRIPAIRGLTLEFGEFLELNESDRIDYLLRRLEQKTGADEGEGTSRFERLLTVFGLGGYLTETCRKNVFEMFKVRNVIVHRGGRVDSKLLRECPWLDGQAGEQIDIPHADVARFADAVEEYVAVLMLRVSVHFDSGIGSRSLAAYKESGWPVPELEG